MAFMVAMEFVTAAIFLPVLLFGFEVSEVPAFVWALIVASAVIHAFYVYWLSLAYAAADLAVVYPIARSAPAILPLIAWPLFGESPSPGGWTGIGLVVFGMWVVQTGGQLRRGALIAPGIGFAYLTLGATVAFSLVDKEAMRLLGDATWTGWAPRSLVYMALFYMPYVVAFFALALRRVTTRELRETARRSPGTVLAAGIVGVASYGLVLEALRSAPVSYVVAVRQTSVLFALAIGVAMLRERPGRARIAGSIAIVVGVAAIALSP